MVTEPSARPKLGLLLTGGGGLGVADLALLARRAESAGFDGAYLVEAWRSTPACLAAIALGTENIRIGPYVMNAHARSPLFAGMTAVDVDEIAQGRLALAVGSGNRVTNERYQGVPVVKPLAKMRDYLAILRLVTQAVPGTTVEYEGEFHSSSGWVSQVEPVRDRIPIHLAATSPKMELVAAEGADGVAMGSLVSAELVADVGDRCRAASGRNDFEVRAAAFVSVDDDAERARDAARRAVVNLYAGKPHPHYDALLRRQGFEATADKVGDHVARGDLDAAADAVEDGVIHTLTISGTPDECRQRLGDYAEAADELILMNVAAMRFDAFGSGNPSEKVNRTAQLLDSYGSLTGLVGQG